MQKDKQGRNWYPGSGYKTLQEFCDFIACPNAPLIIYDTETTGTRAQSAYICQISALKFEHINGLWKISDAMNQYIKPPVPMPESASAVNHITDELLADKPTEAEFFPTIQKFFDGCAIGGYNQDSYDNIVMNTMYTRVAAAEFKPEQSFDGLTMARGLVNRSEVADSSYHLGMVAELYGVKPEAGQLHDAMTDIQVTAQLMGRMGEDYYTNDYADYKLQAVKPPITFGNMHYIFYGAKAQYVMMDVSCLGEIGVFQYEPYNKRFTETRGEIMNMGNMEAFVHESAEPIKALIKQEQAKQRKSKKSGGK